MKWDLITNIILIAALVTLAVFAGLGVYQWITRKSLKKVDKRLTFMLIPLAIMAVTYFVFDKFIILNVRPDGSNEPSFPSTHVMIVATIFLLVAMNLKTYIRQKPLQIVIYAIMLILLVLTCVGRVLANKHWISDVLGALAFSAIFTEIYYFIIKKWSK